MTVTSARNEEVEEDKRVEDRRKDEWAKDLLNDENIQESKDENQEEK